jgi:hypothetical protein
MMLTLRTINIDEIEDIDLGTELKTQVKRH